MKENYSNQKVMFHLAVIHLLVSIKVWTYYFKGIRQNVTNRCLS